MLDIRYSILDKDQQNSALGQATTGELRVSGDMD